MIKRLTRLFLFTLVLLVPLYSQESGEQQEIAQEERVSGWKWANFAILAIGLGYLISKTAPAFFNARSEEIQKAIKEATGLKVEADFRSSEIDRRMATLAAEVQKMRDEAKLEMERESHRLDEETRTALDRVQQHTTREIEALRHQALLSVRDHAVHLASELAIAHLQDHPEEIDQDQQIHVFATQVLEGAR
jgi:F0F1-type ATP synthase membrane subunit b/b'